MGRTRQAHRSHRPSPAGGGRLVAASGKAAPCRSGAAVPGCGCQRRLAASSIAGRDARPTRRRDACATKFTQDYAAPTALGRIELKIPINFSTRFGNGPNLPKRKTAAGRRRMRRTLQAHGSPGFAIVRFNCNSRLDALGNVLQPSTANCFLPPHQFRRKLAGMMPAGIIAACRNKFIKAET